MRTRSRRAALACATAATTALLLAIPGAASSADSAPVLPGWAVAAPDALDTNKVLAPGVEHFRYQENAVTDPAHARYGLPRRELNILRIDPAKGSLRIESTTGRKAGTAEIVRDQLNANTGNLPIAGINGSYFMPEGVRAGDPEGTLESVQSFGATARDGVLLGAACQTTSARRSLVLQHGIPYITLVRTELSATTHLASAEGGVVGSMVIDDVNRNPGVALACPREAGDGPKAVFTHPEGKEIAAYQDATEFVLFNDRYGLKTPRPNLMSDAAITADDHPGYEVLIAEDGSLSRPAEWGAERGGKTVPQGQHILQAVGEQPSAWLKDMLDKGGKLTVQQKMFDTFGNREIPLDESVDVISGGHRLFGNGTNEAPSIYKIDEANGTLVTDPVTGEQVKAEMVKQPDGKMVPVFTSCARQDPTGAKIYCQDSRTVVGVDNEGRTLFATITGPRDESDPAIYGGGFFAEITRPLEKFGVMDAINLDGGGSTMMLIRDSAHEHDYQRHTGLTDPKHRPVFDSVYVGLGGELLG